MEQRICTGGRLCHFYFYCLYPFHSTVVWLINNNNETRSTFVTIIIIIIFINCNLVVTKESHSVLWYAMLTVNMI